MVTILVDNISNAFFSMEMIRDLIQISLKFVSRSPIDNKPEVIQAMAWCWIGDKPLSEPMLAQFTDAYMRH